MTLKPPANMVLFGKNIYKFQCWLWMGFTVMDIRSALLSEWKAIISWLSWRVVQKIFCFFPLEKFWNTLSTLKYAFLQFWHKILLFRTVPWFKHSDLANLHFSFLISSDWCLFSWWIIDDYNKNADCSWFLFSSFLINRILN